MGQKLSSLVFNSPRAKTKTVLIMACKMELKSSIIQSVRDKLGLYLVCSYEDGQEIEFMVMAA